MVELWKHLEKEKDTFSLTSAEDQPKVKKTRYKKKCSDKLNLYCTSNFSSCLQQQLTHKMEASDFNDFKSISQNNANNKQAKLFENVLDLQTH